MVIMYLSSVSPFCFIQNRLCAADGFVCTLLILLLLLTIPAKRTTAQEFPVMDLPYPVISSGIHDTTYINLLIDKGKEVVNHTPDSAIVFLKEALAHSDRMHYSRGVVHTLKFLTEAYINKGAIDTCFLLCRQALYRYSISVPFRDVPSAVYNILGNLNKLQGNYTEAVKYYYESLRQTDTKNAAAAYSNLATVFITLGQQEEALRYLDKAERLAWECGHHEALGYALLNKGLVYGTQQKWENSEHYLDSSLTIAQEYGLIQMQYLALAHKGGVFLQKKMPWQALDYLSQTQRLKGAVNPDYQVFAAILTGEAYLAMEKHEQAKRFFLSALKKAEKNKLNELPVHALLAQVYKHQGQYREALKHHETYKKLSDELLNKETTQQINQMNVRYSTVQKDKEIARNQLLISIQKNQLKTQRLWITGISACTVILGLCLWMLYRNYRHKQQLGEKTQEIQQLKATLLGEEKERRRMARELHDGIVSQLMAIRLGIHTLKERDDVILPEELEEVHSQIKETTDDLRKAAHNLIPDALQDHGLAAAVVLLCEKTEKNTGLDVTLEVFQDIPRYDPDMELSTFRIIQELVQNVLKHARARTLLVQLSCRNDILHITVEDDGTGIPKHHNGHGAGLKNIMDRIKAINGMIHVESVPGGGTTIYIEHSINLTKSSIAYAH